MIKTNLNFIYGFIKIDYRYNTTSYSVIINNFTSIYGEFKICSDGFFSYKTMVVF